VSYATARARPKLRSLFAGAMAVCLCAAVSAQPPAGTQANELAKLQDEVQQLKVQQQQILTGIEDLKKLLVKTNNGPPPVKAPETMSVAGEPFRGVASAPVAIIEYGDFECPFCRRFEHETYPQIRDAYINTGKARYFYRDMPLPFHQQAVPAARAARCAADQGKFWEMHDSLLAATESLSASDIDKHAQSLGLDVAKLDGCVASDRFADVIQRSSGEANKMQVSGTPTFLIGTLTPNGDIVNVKKTVVGAFPFDAFKAAIDPLLASATVQR
jgi:protein-disulfide isomerase